MWIEEVTLPSDPMARANAQLGRLDARIREVRIALGSGNAGAAEAALEAYAVIVADLDAQAAANSAVAASVEDDIARRQVVLIGLLDEVPAQAQDAIQHALQQGANALDGTGANPRPVNPGSGGAGQGGQGSQGGSGQGSQPEPTDAPEPDRTPKPTKPPKVPTADPTPESQPAPPTEPAGGGGPPNEGESGNSSRQDAPGGSQGGPSNDQGND
jgi:hypothetical protein